eukprot:CAMPEP_0168600548 /NCGR_PEP_ID=MMETSP0420-20121227/12850_1 /TAXON_ID=498008 /ORGANISM="Pessonella sp." /LENGTH=1155 /DNA_ID=CAMNT_0008638661 /DNA_START=287 /DNA_END=3754 /DNA_ORIENTATION=-
MAANRGEIAIRVFRAATEANIQTVAIYSHADNNSAHRYKADQAFQVGSNTDDPVGAYLNIDAIVKIAKENQVDAIHPGYGFLSESAEFAKAVEDAGIIFIGPHSSKIATLGDKVSARKLAKDTNIPTLVGSDEAVSSVDEVKGLLKDGTISFPIIFKASAGGGGRGMRVVRDEKGLEAGFADASSEARAAFGNGDLFVERYVENARHIEVQIIADAQGNVLHVYERDCSVQRRHQKVVEIAPAPHLDDDIRQALLSDAVRLCQAAGYTNAGTVEFLYDVDKKQHYFIEVNTRLQVEHTVSEVISGVDLVQAQFAVAGGLSLADIGLKSQKDIVPRGYAIQCRVTTEDAERGFTPDTGRIIAYREPQGFGIRLDGANGYAGSEISPYFDSLLVKVTASGLTWQAACAKMARALVEFRVRGLNTNLSFLRRVFDNQEFLDGGVTTSFIERHAKTLMSGSVSKNRAGRLMDYLAHVTVNGATTPLGMPNVEIPRVTPPTITVEGPPRKHVNLKHILDAKGPEAFAKAVRESKDTLLTDTTMRDAHQSLLATRVRSYDLMNVAKETNKTFSAGYSVECWGGATFDVAMRFLYEDPFDRLRRLRADMPDVCLQMLLRGANAVGYTAYPDNVVEEFVKSANEAGVDVFRVFDSLNDVENMKLGAQAVLKTKGVLEAAVCYTGISKHYDLDYYLNVADKMVNELKCHVLAVKDMAGLLTPSTATLLIKALRKKFPDTPIHVHTHDTAGTGVSSMLACAKAGADAVDAAVDSMSGLTSQPSMGALVACEDKTVKFNVRHSDLTQLSNYWEVVRGQYAPFEATATLRSVDSSVIEHQIPGGQLTNMNFQAFSLGLGDQFGNVKQKYIEANRLLGDIIKVTPSSKVVGDLAQFMTANNLSHDDVVARADELDFPESVVDFFRGGLGQHPRGQWPEPLRSKILRGQKPLEGRPGKDLKPVNFDRVRFDLEQRHPHVVAVSGGVSKLNVMASLMYPKEFDDFWSIRKRWTGAVWRLPTWAFWKGLKIGEDVNVNLGAGKDVNIKLKSLGVKTKDDEIPVHMELNGVPRTLYIRDERKTDEKSSGAAKRPKATDDLGSVGAPMPGAVVEVKVKVGDKVEKGQKLAGLSAMKMVTSVSSPCDGVVKAVQVSAGEQVKNGDELFVIEPQQ